MAHGPPLKHPSTVTRYIKDVSANPPAAQHARLARSDGTDFGGGRRVFTDLHGPERFAL